MKQLALYIGEGFEGPGVNAAHINIMMGPRSGPAGQAFASSLASPSQGHCPFMVIAAPNIPVKRTLARSPWRATTPWSTSALSRP